MKHILSFLFYTLIINITGLLKFLYLIISYYTNMLFYFNFIKAKSICIPGSAECVGDVMRTCGSNGHWTYVDCPYSSTCKIINDAISCINEKKEIRSILPQDDSNETDFEQPFKIFKLEEKFPKGKSHKAAMKAQNEQILKEFHKIYEAAQLSKALSNSKKHSQPIDSPQDKKSDPKGITLISTIIETGTPEPIQSLLNSKKEKKTIEVTYGINSPLSEIHPLLAGINGPKIMDKSIDYRNTESIINHIASVLSAMPKANSNLQNPVISSLSTGNNLGKDFIKGINNLNNTSIGNTGALSSAHSDSSSNSYAQSLSSADASSNASNSIPQATDNPSNINSAANAKSSSSANASSIAQDSLYPNNTSNDMALGSSNAIASGKSNTSASGSSNASASGSSNASAPGVSNASASGSSNASASGSSNAIASGSSNAVASGVSNASASGSSNAIASGQSSASTSGKSNSTASSNAIASSANYVSNKGNAGNLIISSQILKQVMTEMGFNPKPEHIDAIVKVTNEKFQDKNNAIMFLAQCAHESGGYQYVEEIACVEDPSACIGKYGIGVPGQSYHGRGFIQLSWPDNYLQAGKYLGMGNKLYLNPGLVAKDLNIGALCAVWYWKEIVEKSEAFMKYKSFGSTTKAINGVLECTNNNNKKQSVRRYEIYKKLAAKMNITKLASEAGCYTL